VSGVARRHAQEPNRHRSRGTLCLKRHAFNEQQVVAVRQLQFQQHFGLWELGLDDFLNQHPASAQIQTAYQIGFTAHVFIEEKIDSRAVALTFLETHGLTCSCG